MSIKQVYHYFNTALAFLTIFRLPGLAKRTYNPEDFAASLTFFPLVGLVVGTLAASFVALIHRFLPPLLIAFGVIGLEAAATRGLHHDGIADCADGIGGGYNHQSRLDIMKDSRVGTFGVLALILDIVLKSAAVEVLIDRLAYAIIIIVPVLSRYAMVVCAAGMPYARKQGLGRPFLQHMGHRQPLWASVIATALALSLVGFYAWRYLAVVLLSVFVIRKLALRWLGGITGDVLGATNEISEMILYILAVFLLYS